MSAEILPKGPGERWAKTTSILFTLNLIGIIFLGYFLIASGSVRFTTKPFFIEAQATYTPQYRTERIIIPRDIYPQLADLWTFSEQTGKETARCVTIKDNVITGVTPAPILNYSGDTVVFTDFCKGNSIHTHPNGVCAISPEDAIFFHESRNPYILVMCGPKDFGIFDDQHLQQTYTAVMSERNVSQIEEVLEGNTS